MGPKAEVAVVPFLIIDHEPGGEERERLHLAEETAMADPRVIDDAGRILRTAQAAPGALVL